MPRRHFCLFGDNKIPKGTSLHQNTRFELSTMQIGSVVRAVREAAKIVRKRKM
jgi:hypothetical protein